MLDRKRIMIIIGGMRRVESGNFVNKEPSRGYACSPLSEVRLRQAWPSGGFFDLRGFNE